MATTAVTLDTRDDFVAEGDSVLYFTAAWCGPCQQFGPLVEEVSDSETAVRFGKVDIDANPELAEQYGIRSIPTLVGHKNGVVTVGHRGATGLGQLKGFVEQVKAG